jgi:hypothetical protein
MICSLRDPRPRLLRTAAGMGWGWGTGGRKTKARGLPARVSTQEILADLTFCDENCASKLRARRCGLIRGHKQGAMLQADSTHTEKLAQWNALMRTSVFKLREAHPAQEVRKTRVASQPVESGIHPDEGHSIRTGEISLFKPGEGALLVTQGGVYACHVIPANVALPRLCFDPA